MTRRRDGLAGSSDGTAAVEFAIAGPVLILMLVGTLQMGLLFLARAGLGQAIEAGARYATIYPRPTDAQITSLIQASGYGMNASGITGPTLSHGTSNGSPYVDITMSYSMTLDFGLYRTAPISFGYTRRAYQVG